LYEYKFSRKLDTNEALTLERSLVCFGSRLVHDEAAVIGAICKPQDLYRWLRNDGIKNLGVQLIGKERPSHEPGLKLAHVRDCEGQHRGALVRVRMSDVRR
jgi:hypothetical protein